PVRRTSPSTGWMSPPTAFSSVDFAQPEGPRITYRSERNTWKPTRYVAVTRWSLVLYCRVTPRTSRSGSAMRGYDPESECTLSKKRSFHEDGFLLMRPTLFMNSAVTLSRCGSSVNFTFGS